MASHGPQPCAPAVTSRRGPSRTRRSRRCWRRSRDSPSPCCAGCAHASAKRSRFPVRRAAELPLLPQGLQGLVEDRLAVLVAAPLADVGKMTLVRRRARRRRGVVLVTPGGEAAPRAVPELGELRVGRERRPALVPVGAPEGDAPSRGGLAALGFAHRTSADPAPPDRVAPGHGDASAHTPCLRTSPCATIAAAHTMPTKIVIRSRFFSTTDEPDNVEDTPPPNRSERPPPLPRCSRISSTSSKLVIINTTEISSDMESLGSGCGVASSVPDPARLVEPH